MKVCQSLRGAKKHTRSRMICRSLPPPLTTALSGHSFFTFSFQGSLSGSEWPVGKCSISASFWWAFFTPPTHMLAAGCLLGTHPFSRSPSGPPIVHQGVPVFGGDALSRHPHDEGCGPGNQRHQGSAGRLLHGQRHPGASVGGFASKAVEPHAYRGADRGGGTRLLTDGYAPERPSRSK